MTSSDTTLSDTSIDVLEAPADGPYAGEKVEILDKIGSGSHGDVFMGIYANSNIRVAIKMESLNAKSQLLIREREIYKELEGAAGVPKIHFLCEYKAKRALVMDLLGKSLLHLFKTCGTLSLKMVTLLGIKLLCNLEELHNRGVIHKDLKPGNVVFGVDGDENDVYLVDFGVSSMYMLGGRHIPFEQNRRIAGTPTFMSISQQLGHQVSRRDDLESLGYLMLFMLNGSLPWKHVSGSGKDRFQNILTVKQETTVDEMCEGLPHQYTEYFNYAFELAFQEEPNYDYLRGLFVQVLHERSWSKDSKFDWTPTGKNSYFI